MIETTFILITQLNQHQMILEKTWMNKIDLVINMWINSLQFLKSVVFKEINQSEFYRFKLSEICKIKWKNLKLIILSMKQKSLTSTQILKRSSSVFTQLSQKLLSFSQKKKFIEQLKSHHMTLTNVKISKSTSDSINIIMIETVIYKMLIKWSDVKIFAVIILKIDWIITIFENKSKEVNLHELFHIEALKQVKIKLLSEYYDYLNIFDRTMTDQLSFHCFYDHKIELIDKETSSWSKLYQMFNHKLQKIKKYLINHLNKEFIFFSFTSYVSLILFIEKKDDSLRFCIDYRKLNALIKRDCYSLSLIDETFACIQESKYLIWLNIIICQNRV